MDCPRCGDPLRTYTFGDRETISCDGCGYADVRVQHEREPREWESWDDALARFAGSGVMSGEVIVSIGPSGRSDSVAGRSETSIADGELAGTVDAVVSERGDRGESVGNDDGSSDQSVDGAGSENDAESAASEGTASPDDAESDPADDETDSVSDQDDATDGSNGDEADDGAPVSGTDDTASGVGTDDEGADPDEADADSAPEPDPAAGADEEATGRCVAQTNAGNRCSRDPKPGERYCPQHLEMVAENGADAVTDYARRADE